MITGRDSAFVVLSLPCALAGAAGVTLVLADRVWRPFPDALPAVVSAWTATAVLAFLWPGPDWAVPGAGVPAPSPCWRCPPPPTPRGDAGSEVAARSTY